MGTYDYVLLCLKVGFQPINILFCFFGVLIGTLVGVLPGLGPVAAMALLLPITFHLTPVTAIIMLSGIYYGAMYGGSTTSILVNIPGEAASVVTCLDGYQMARKGRAGPALGMAAFGSFIAGTIGVLVLMLVANPNCINVRSPGIFFFDGHRYDVIDLFSPRVKDQGDGSRLLWPHPQLHRD